MKQTKEEKRENEIRDNFEYAISAFNFYKVQIAMSALSWTWALSGGRIPTVIEMEENVRRLFESALIQRLEEDVDRVICGSGGFNVEIYVGNLVNIQFIIEEYSSEGNE